MQPFTISLNGLAQGRTRFLWRAEGEFFSGFENSEILDADLDVEVEVEKSGRFIGIDCNITGSVTVLCDRCLGELKLPVDSRNSFSVKFGEVSEFGSSVNSGEREIIFISEENTEVDMSQVIYDYTCLSLPMLHVHEDGECDPETVKYLNSEEAQQELESSVETESPFASLKNLFENK